ncbi:MAG: hypothetical protein NTU54_05255 [Candidatus Omnitrophica bacterium]|nr:hypothetical protein [Candidatus Omnitrophota bacterium]
MAWEPIYRYARFARDGDLQSALKVNNQCFIRKAHKCGKIFGASKSCFIACPSDASIETILALMSEKLAKVGVEPIIAVKERAYGQDIFCTKICGKIIESKFCIVVLDDTIVGSKSFPNPNVYYEYGLMTSLRKHIIPLQKEKLKLAFNIQSYDTVKYSDINISSELDRAIKDAIKISESSEKVEQESHISDKTILRKFELVGFDLKNDEWFLNDVIDDTNFKGFGHSEKRGYLYLGNISSENEFQIYLEDFDIVLYRTEKKAKEIKEEIQFYQKRQAEAQAEAQTQEGYVVPVGLPGMRRSGYPVREFTGKINEAGKKLKLMEKISVGFIIAPQLNSEEFLKKCKAILSKYNGRYKLVCSDVDNNIEVDDIKVSLTTVTS